jgi:hypothetical protein
MEAPKTALDLTQGLPKLQQGRRPDTNTAGASKASGCRSVAGVNEVRMRYRAIKTLVGGYATPPEQHGRRGGSHVWATG